MRRVMLQEVNGPRQFHVHESVWGCIVELIVTSEAVGFDQWQGLSSGRGCRIPGEQAREIATFVEQFLKHNPGEGAFAPGGEGEADAGGGAPARTLSRPSVSRAQLVQFARFCEEAREGFTIW